jgi:tricarballylate dehydrogenase
VEDFQVDVLVVGAGNTAACAALEHGASVAMLEAAPPDECGDNSSLRRPALTERRR